ncbi:MAG: Imm26 family immunity protein [Erythrobacter sp.]
MSRRRKNIELKCGDVFELALPDGRCGYGIVVNQGVLPDGGTPYIAIFSTAYAEPPSVFEATQDKVALQGWTTDALIYRGEWKLIAHGAPIPAIHFPNFKVTSDAKVWVVDVSGQPIDVATPQEIDVLDYQFSSTATIFKKAFEALHGFGEWKSHFDKLTPQYVRTHMTRPAKR